MNERPLKAIRKLAKQRTPDNRKAMYMAVLRRLSSSQRRVRPRTGLAQFAQDAPLQGRPVFVAFTSVDAMKNWRPENAHYHARHGLDGEAGRWTRCLF